MCERLPCYCVHNNRNGLHLNLRRPKYVYSHSSNEKELDQHRLLLVTWQLKCFRNIYLLRRHSVKLLINTHPIRKHFLISNFSREDIKTDVLTLHYHDIQLLKKYYYVIENQTYKKKKH